MESRGHGPNNPKPPISIDTNKFPHTITKEEYDVLNNLPGTKGDITEEPLDTKPSSTNNPIPKLPKSSSEVTWREQAACRDIDSDTSMQIFFPSGERERDPMTKRAKEICSTCPVSEKCLDYALDQRIEHGIWGGRTSNERVKLARILKYLKSLPRKPRQK